MVFDSQLLAELLECVVVKLFSIVEDKDSGDAKAANNVLPEEASNILLNDSGQGFCLDPFSEVVDSYNEELKLPHCYGEGSHYVKPPLSKWLGSVHWGKVLRRLSYDVAKALAFVACLYVGLGVLYIVGQ